MATARREESEVEDEEFNPFLSPPPPPLANPVLAPPLPPRISSSTTTSINPAAGGSGVSSSSFSRRGSASRGRTPSGQSAAASPPHAPPVPTTTTTTATTTSTTLRDSSSSATAGARQGSRSSPASSRLLTGVSPPAPSITSPPVVAGATHRRGSGRRNAGSTSDSSGSSGGSTTSRSNTVSHPTPAPAAVPQAARPLPATSASPPITATTTPGGSSAASSASISSNPNLRRGAPWNWGSLGRTLIGAVLGPHAIGGDEGGGAGDRAGGGARRHRFRELTPHEMLQTPEGKFSVSVWKKNKQDAESVKVPVGVYDSAYEGQRAAESFSPPIWQSPSKNSRCAACDSTFGYVLKRRHHCRNCGRLVCSSCAETFWPRNMLPPTYHVDTGEKKVRVCSTCHGAGEDFRKACLSGSEEEAMAAFSTGCVNLRVPYTIYHNELPVHCAASGGNLNILAWLVEDRCCPLFLDREKKIALGDSRRLSVMGAAAAAGHVQIMRYLAFTQGCKVTEIRDMNSLWRALEKCLYDGANVLPAEITGHRSRHDSRGSPSYACSGGGSGGGGGSGNYASSAAASGPGGAAGGAEVAAPVGDDDNLCIVCFERKVDCTLVPCGHHCCCLTCAAQFEQCPVCRADVEQKIRAISV